MENFFTTIKELKTQNKYEHIYHLKLDSAAYKCCVKLNVFSKNNFKYIFSRFQTLSVAPILIFSFLIIQIRAFYLL